MQGKKTIRFFPIFIGAVMGVLLEIIATLIDEIIVGNMFTDEVFASVNLIEPYTFIEIFLAYLVTVAAAALIVRPAARTTERRWASCSARRSSYAASAARR